MKKQSVLPFVALCLFAFPALAQQSSTITLEPTVHGLMKVHATVSGHEGTFLFDSGSGVTSVSPEFAASIGCHPWGQITGFRMAGDRLNMQLCEHLTFSVGGKSFAPPAVGVFDVSKYIPAEVGHVDGTVALDLFANQAFTLSYGGHFLKVLDDKEIARRSQERRMPARLVRTAEGLALTVDIPVKTSAGTTWFEVDSGNTSPFVFVNSPLAPLFELPVETKQAPIKLLLGDGSAFEGKARVLNLILDGNLGTSFLNTHDITIDVPHAVAWVDPTDSALRK
jgi:hypothetical protein